MENPAEISIHIPIKDLPLSVKLPEGKFTLIVLASVIVNFRK